MLFRIWTAKTNVQPLSDNLVNGLRRNNPKNVKLLGAIDAMFISIEEMKKRIAEEMGKRNEPSFEKRCLRSTNVGIQNRNAVQVPVDAPTKMVQKICTRNNKTKKKEIGIETKFPAASKPDEKKHYLRSTRTVSVLISEQTQKEAAKRHRNVSFQASENPPQKRARKTKTTKPVTKERSKSPIAARTRSQITKQQINTK